MKDKQHYCDECRPVDYSNALTEEDIAKRFKDLEYLLEEDKSNER